MSTKMQQPTNRRHNFLIEKTKHFSNTLKNVSFFLHLLLIQDFLVLSLIWNSWHRVTHTVRCNGGQGQGGKGIFKAFKQHTCSSAQFLFCSVLWRSVVWCSVFWWWWRRRWWWCVVGGIACLRKGSPIPPPPPPERGGTKSHIGSNSSSTSSARTQRVLGRPFAVSL